MNYKKTFWMNVFFAICFLSLTVELLFSSGLELFTAKDTYTTAMGLTMLYVFAVSSVPSLVSAYALKTNNKLALANVLNVLQIALVVVISVYSFTEPKSMSKFNLQIISIVSLLVYVTPSAINLRALAKLKAS